MIEWKLPYHRTLVIRNASHEYTIGQISLYDTEFHHELGPTVPQRLNECTQHVITFIGQREKLHLASNSERPYHFTIGQPIIF